MHDNLFCNQFEDLLTDYLDGALDKATSRGVAAHALRCPMCHALLNEVKLTIKSCREADVPAPSAQMEARILQMTQPETAMSCGEFEELLTEYLDGFLPAAVFHRWERHAYLCKDCTDLPGEVVRSIAVCYTAKADELAVPEGLHAKILQATLGTEKAADVQMPLIEQIKQTLRDFLAPILQPALTPQFASAATMLLLAFFLFTSSSSDGSFTTALNTGYKMAEQTYAQGASVVGANISEPINEGNSDGQITVQPAGGEQN
jgi:anti-sigma factor RsiW